MVRLKHEVAKFARGVGAALPAHLQLYQHQLDALTSFAYNIGLPAFRGSTMAAMLRRSADGEELGEQETRTIASEFTRWVYAGGRRLAGLERRRSAERLMFIYSSYDTTPFS